MYGASHTYISRRGAPVARRGLRTAALVTLLTASPLALADETPSPLEAALELEQDVVVASFDVTGAFTDRFRRKLGGGLKSQVVIEMSLRDQDDAEVASNIRECQLRLDIWDDLLAVGFREADRQVRQRTPVIDAGLAVCGKVERASLGRLPALTRAHGYRLLVTVTLNPISEELLQKTREFLANPRGRPAGGQRTIFGAVSRFFRSNDASSEERFRFRSAPLSRPVGSQE